MKLGIRIVCITLITLIGSLFVQLPALAVPQLPSSFYGTAKVNGVNVPDGTIVQALIDGKMYANTITQTYQGDSVYSVNVTGDDTDTTAVDGGREGDTVQFKIGGVLAGQTGIWHSGTNVNLNLSASTSTPLATPQATHTTVPTKTATPQATATTVPTKTSTPKATATHAPTQTSMPTQQPATPLPPTRTAVSAPTATEIQAGATSATVSQPSPVPTEQAQPGPVSNTPQLPTPTSARSDARPGSSSFTMAAIIVMVTLVVLMIIGYVIMANREKKV